MSKPSTSNQPVGHNRARLAAVLPPSAEHTPLLLDLADALEAARYRITQTSPDGPTTRVVLHHPAHTLTATLGELTGVAREWKRGVPEPWRTLEVPEGGSTVSRTLPKTLL